jgi:hypothetical protein
MVGGGARLEANTMRTRSPRERHVRASPSRRRPVRAGRAQRGGARANAKSAGGRSRQPAARGSLTISSPAAIHPSWTTEK